MMPRRVRLASLIAFLCHAVFILSARYRQSYDAYTHMFFADHYARDWWSLWEPRWFGGFEINSYPPLVHQTIGLLSHLTGVDPAYGLTAWVVLAAYPLGAYTFCRIFCGRSASGYAALGAALLPSIYYSAHAFGQLPTLTATLIALFGLSALAEYLRSGKKISGALAVSLITVLMAAHHATLLFLPWGVVAVVLHIILNQKVDGPAFVVRLLLFAVFSTLGILLVIWPFWAWGAAQIMQTPIDHLSRHNFLVDHFAFVAFFLPMYGPLIVFIPFAFYLGRYRRFFGLFMAFIFLLVLGLGGTTPLPRWIFGTGWEWLTYDRFAFWASLLLLPFFGTVMSSASRFLPGVLTVSSEVVATRFSKPFIKLKRTNRFNPRRWAIWITLGIFGLVSFIAGFIPELMHTQPDPVDMQPIVDFLAADDHSTWRYLTFGLGDQLAYLSRLTNAETLDGSYFTARTLPELTTSGIGQIDLALWSSRGLPALDPILQESGERGVRWGFVNRMEYIPVLRRNDWIFVENLTNGIQVWENPHASLPPPTQPPTLNPLAEFSWGILPLLAALIASALAITRLSPVNAKKILFAIQSLAVGLLPIGLTFWYYRPLTAIEYPLVYFTYDNALVFISDGLASIAVLSWSIQRIFGLSPPAGQARKRTRYALHRLFSSINPWFLGLCALSSLSVLWSQDWRISLYASLHLWLVFGLILTLEANPGLWRAFALGCCAALALQVLFGIWQFASQSTAFMLPLELKWLPPLNPAMSGVSVVQTLGGTRLLRVYGSLPHPNILGGSILAFLSGLIALLMSGTRWNVRLTILFGLTVTLLLVTFSRAAWIGFGIAMLLLIFFYRRHLNRKRLGMLALTGLIGLLAVLIPLREYIFVRVTNAPVHTEAGSFDMRLWLIERSLTVIKQHALLGVGIGSYTIASARGLTSESLGVPPDFLIEPVHNVLLLAQGELGIPGTFILLGLYITILSGSIRARGGKAVILSSVLIGMFSLELFDHFLWTLAPGRMLFGLILGLWQGQVLNNIELNDS